MLLGHKQLVFSWPHTRIYHAPCYAVIHSECFCYEDWKISVSHVFSPQKVDETTKTGLVQIPHLTISENDNPSRFARKWPDILRLAETVGFRFCLFTCFYFHVNWQKEKRAVSLSFQKITFPAEFWQFVCLFVCLFCRGLFTGLVHTKTISTSVSIGERSSKVWRHHFENFSIRIERSCDIYSCCKNVCKISDS